jgi:hydrogenase expression/formation protein HypC
MCLAIPMQVLAIDGRTARCGAKGIEREVSLFLLEAGGVQVGDYVMVHVGYAIQKVQPEAARSAWELYDQAVSGGQGSTDA